MQPPVGATCGEYLGPFAQVAGGEIYNPNARADCQYCSISTADQFLAGSQISYSTRWRDYGIVFAYIVFNIFMAVLLYYLIRVRKSSGRSMREKFAWILKLFQKDASARKDTTDARAQAPQVKTKNVLPMAEDGKEER
jgi:ATP-binding cassette subfamily G (WHITE) protein 2 (PDR)